VTVRTLDAGDFRLLESLAGGGQLAAALECALAVDPAFDLGTALASYLTDGVLVECQAPSTRRLSHTDSDQEVQRGPVHHP